jgi:hypothetical protein
MVPLSKAIVIPRDLIADTREVQRLVLFFDRIIVYLLDRTELTAEQADGAQRDLEYLVERKVALRCAVTPPVAFLDQHGKDIDFLGGHVEIRIPMLAVLVNRQPYLEGLNPVDRVIREVAAGLHDSRGNPVATHIQNPTFAEPNAGYTPCVEIALKNMPLPPDNLPWEDLIQFRQDPENVEYLRNFRLWLQEQALAANPHLLQEKLEALLADYRKYMKLAHGQYGEGVWGTIVTTALDAFEQLMNARLGSAIRALVDVRARRIALAQHEMSAPGREVAYLARVQTLGR